MIVIPTPVLRWAASFLCTCALLAATGGCKPAAAPRPAQAALPDDPTVQAPGAARRQPSTHDLANYWRGQAPATVRVVEVKSDPPVLLPGTSPASNAWLINFRLTLAPTEDLFVPAPAPDTQALQALVDELQGLADWSAAYARSPYAPLSPGFEVKPLSAIAPQLLVVQQPKGRPAAPLYGKASAEWQVDHWNFALLEMPLPAAAGKFRSEFTGPTLIQHSPEAERFLATATEALTQAKASRAAIERRYQEELVQATKPSTIYRGELRLRSNGFHKDPVPAEVRFLDVVPGADSPQAQFVVKLPQVPSYEFTFRTNRSAELPLLLPSVPRSFGALPPGDLTMTAAHASGKDDNGVTLAGLLVSGLHNGLMPGDQPLSVHNHQRAGTLASIMVGEVVLAVEREPRQP